ncbi:MAG: hypothetical protein ACOX2A_03140 [Tepidanaerobacteraceae bacterium]
MMPIIIILLMVAVLYVGYKTDVNIGILGMSVAFLVGAFATRYEPRCIDRHVADQTFCIDGDYSLLL